MLCVRLLICPLGSPPVFRGIFKFKKHKSYSFQRSKANLILRQHLACVCNGALEYQLRPHRHRSGVAVPLQLFHLSAKMLRKEGERAAQVFVDDVRNVITKCTNDTAEVRRTFAKGPLGTGSEAIAFSTTMQAEMEQLKDQYPLLETFSKESPRVDDMLSAAFANLKAITDVFDRFEERLQSAYDIDPVVVPVKPQLNSGQPSESDAVPEASVASVSDYASLATVGSMPASSSISRPKTPPRTQEESVIDLPMPKTPQLEDFGISNADLRNLEAAAASKAASRNHEERAAYPIKNTAGSPSLQYAGAGSSLGNRDLEELAETSIADLGIETPNQVSEKFESRRNHALSQVLATTTPRLRSGGVERTANYTGLAAGYYKSSARKPAVPMDTHRQLNFDETPQVSRQSGGKLAGELSARIADNFGSLGFWCDKISCEILQEAAVMLQQHGDRVFLKKELMDVLTENIPSHSCHTITALLTKLKVLEMHKRQGEEAQYRIA